MRNRLLTQRRVLLLVLVLLLIASQAPASWSRAVTGPPRSALAAALAPVRHPLHLLASHVRGDEDDLPAADRQRLRREYELAKARLNQLELENAALREENHKLRRIQGLVEWSGAAMLPASVTGVEGRGARLSLTLNRGARHGAAMGQAVIDGYVLVGRITQVGPLTSTVMTPLGAGPIPVRLSSPGVDQTVREAQLILTPDDDGFAVEQRVSRDVPVAVGDLAHLVENPRWPPEATGFVVAEVTSVEDWPDDPLRYQQVRLAPPRSYDYQRRVHVLIPRSGVLEQP